VAYSARRGEHGLEFEGPNRQWNTGWGTAIWMPGGNGNAPPDIPIPFGDCMAVVFGLRSWYSKNGGFLSPNEAVAAARALGASAIAFADVHERGGTFEWLDACREHGVMPIMGIELNIMFRDQARPALLFARGKKGVESLDNAVAGANLSGGEELSLELKDNSLEETLLCTGGYEGHFHRLASGRDLVGLEAFMELVRRTGARPIIGLDPQFRDPYTLEVYRRLGERYAVVPYRPAIYRNKEEHATYADAARVIWSEPREPFINDGTIQTTEALTQQAIAGGGYKFELKWQMLLERADLDCSSAYEAVSEPGRLEYQSLTEEAALEEIGAKAERTLTERLEISGDEAKVYRARLAQELEAIGRLRMAGYLLHLSDIATSARDAQIPIGPGRGSSLNSLACFCLGITQIDPVKERLPFERFLNVNRRDLPDVDIDVGRLHAERFRKIVGERFAECASIRNFSKPTLRAFLERALRQRGIEENQIIVILKAVEDECGPRWQFRGLAELRERFPGFEERFAQIVGDQARAHWALQLVESIGTERPVRASVHESGIGVCRQALRKTVPLQHCQKGDAAVLCVAVPRAQAEQQGVVKIDILGLDILDQLCSINRRIAARGEKAIDLNPGTLEEGVCKCLIDRGLVSGVFQFSKHAELLNELGIRSINDLLLASGLIRVLEGSSSVPARPDWIEQLPDRLARRYETITAETRGVVVFQEQLSNALCESGGLSPLRAEELRKAIAKGDHAALECGQAEFVAGCCEQFSATQEQASGLFDFFSHNGAYLFNQGHARAYAGLAAAQITAKALYSAETIVELMRSARLSARGDELREQVGRLMYEARALGVPVVGLDLAQSALTDVVYECPSGAQPATGTIRLGLDALAFLDNGKVKSLARTFRTKGPLSAEVVRGQVSNEDFIALVALGGWDKTPVKREDLWSSCFDQSTCMVVPSKQASQHRFLGFLTDDVHPGLPRLDGAIAPGQLGSVLRSQTNTQPLKLVGFISRVACGTRVGASGRVQAALMVSSYLGDKEARVTRFFDSGSQMAAWVQKHQAIDSFTPVVVPFSGNRNRERTYLNTNSDATPLKSCATTSARSAVEAAGQLRIRRLGPLLHGLQPTTAPIENAKAVSPID